MYNFASDKTPFEHLLDHMLDPPQNQKQLCIPSKIEWDLTNGPTLVSCDRTIRYSGFFRGAFSGSVRWRFLGVAMGSMKRLYIYLYILVDLCGKSIHQGKNRWHSYHVLVYINNVLTYLLGTVPCTLTIG